MAFKPRATLPDTAFTLPARYYTDPDIFARELDVFYRQMWIGVARADELATPGACITRRIAGDASISVRSAAGDDDVRAF